MRSCDTSKQSKAARIIFQYFAYVISAFCVCTPVVGSTFIYFVYEYIVYYKYITFYFET